MNLFHSQIGPLVILKIFIKILIIHLNYLFNYFIILIEVITFWKV